MMAIGLVLSAAVLVAPRPAHAGTVTNSCSALDKVTSLYMAVVVNGSCINLSGFITQGKKPGTAQAVGTLTIGSQDISFNAFWYADPFVSFTFGSINALAGAVSYTAIFSTPIVPGLYSYAEATLAGSVIGASGTVINSGGQSTFLTGSAFNAGNQTNLGVGVGTGPCTAPTMNCGNGSASNTFAPATFNMLAATLAYTQNGAGTTVSFVGRVDLLATPPVSNVPEPSTYALVAIGLAAVGVVRRRRQAAR